MKTVACYKVVHDEQDLVVAPDRTVSFDRAGLRIGDYDLNALEAAAQLAAASSGEALALSVGGAEVRDTKLRKSVLSRGLDAAVLVVDDSLAGADSGATAQALAQAVASIGEVDVIVCGEGSADRYAQQVGAQLAAILRLPYVSGVSSVEQSADGLLVERTLEDQVETLAVSLPAVISVTADANSPRIPSMKDILGAGKKPVTELEAAAVDPVTATITVQPERAPQQRQRSAKVYQAGDAAEFTAAVRRLLGKDAK